MSDPSAVRPNPFLIKYDLGILIADLCPYIRYQKTKNQKDGSVSHSTRIRLPLNADPFRLNPNSYLLSPPCWGASFHGGVAPCVFASAH
jgi:hypothetical protein